MKKKILTKTKQLIVGALIISSLTACGSYSDSMTSVASIDRISTSDALNSSEIHGFNTKGVEYESYAESIQVETNESINDDYSNSGATSEIEIEDTEVDIENKNELTEEKLVYNCNLTIETLDYDVTKSNLDELINKYKVLVSSENETDSRDYYTYSTNIRQGFRQNTLQLRVPSNNYHSFLEEVGSLEKVKSKSQSVQNITSQYYDTKTEINSLKIQEERLLEMYYNCSTIEEMITVEKRLTEIQSELSKLQSQLNYMDMDVAYSYITISIKEVIEYTEEEEPVKTSTFFDRLKNTISSTIDATLYFLESLLFFIIRILPFTLIAIGIILIARFILKKLLKKENKTKTKENKAKIKEEQQSDASKDTNSK